jgi:RNA polymerase sigma-70 factor (ECF subfamily)
VDNVLDVFGSLRQSPFVSAAPVREIDADITLVSQARNGNRVAFGELYRRYGRMVHGVLLARVPRPEVDDLVQDVFVLALRRLHTLRDLRAFGGWLAMIARNRATDWHRGSRDTVELKEDAARQNAPDPESLAVLDAIAAMPDAYRETLILRLVEGLTGPEIAKQTGLAPDSVRVNLHRGMKQLREKLHGEARA